MSKLIVLLFLGLIAYLFFRGFQRAAGERRAKGEDAEKDARAPERMVACARCGVHLPEGEALEGEDGERFCSEDHRRLGAA